jgi:hypothetical protein
MTSPQRLPAKERAISEIAPGDVRVCVVGTVVASDGPLVSIDDGTGRIEASFVDSPTASAGQQVKVIGKIVPAGEGVELQGEAFQDFTGGDVRLWKKVSGLWEESLGTL